MGIINATTADFNPMSGSATRTEQNLGGEMTARLLGFLRPPPVWQDMKEQLRICVSHSMATLRLESLTSHLVSPTDVVVIIIIMMDILGGKPPDY